MLDRKVDINESNRSDIKRENIIHDEIENYKLWK